jgi:hypothetical protein
MLPTDTRARPPRKQGVILDSTAKSVVGRTMRLAWRLTVIDSFREGTHEGGSPWQFTR